MQVFKPNMDVVKQEAERIKKEASDKGEFPDLKFYKWKLGENHIRIFPPWSAKGLVFKKQVQHFRLPPENKIIPCYRMSWPDLCEDCFVCDTLDKVLAMFPELDLKRQGPSPQYQANIVDRTDEKEGVQICRFTPALYNWIATQMDKPQVGDITDIEEGVDLIVDKQVTKRRDGQEQTKYVPSFVPRPTMLHEDPEVLEVWLNGIFDLDRVFAHPKEEKVADHSDYIERMLAYYVRKHRSSGVGKIDRGKESSKPETPVDRNSEGDNGSNKPATLEGVDPREVPPCYAGLDSPEPHKGGKIGHDPDLEKCMMCHKELGCIDATANRG